MDHIYIDEHDIANRYVMRTLSTGQSAEFEAHVVDCAECLDRLDAIEGLRAGLKEVAAADASRAPIDRSSTRVRVPWLTGQWHRSVFAQAAVLLVVSTVVYVAIGFAVARRELRQARETAADLQRRHEESMRVAGTLQQRLDEAERKLRSAISAPPASGREPGAIPVFSLIVVRSADMGPSGPPNRISVSRSEPWLVLSLELPGSSGFDAYRATLERDGRATIWSRDGLRPTSPETLAIAMNSSLLAAGDYLMSLYGRTRGGPEVPAGRYPFRYSVK